MCDVLLKSNHRLGGTAMLCCTWKRFESILFERNNESDRSIIDARQVGAIERRSSVNKKKLCKFSPKFIHRFLYFVLNHLLFVC